MMGSRKSNYIPRHAAIRGGNIGEDPREIEYEPLDVPAELPASEPAPVAVPELEPVPA